MEDKLGKVSEIFISEIFGKARQLEWMPEKAATAPRAYAIGICASSYSLFST